MHSERCLEFRGNWFLNGSSAMWPSKGARVARRGTFALTLQSDLYNNVSFSVWRLESLRTVTCCLLRDHLNFLFNDFWNVQLLFFHPAEKFNECVDEASKAHGILKYAKVDDAGASQGWMLVWGRCLPPKCKPASGGKLWTSNPVYEILSIAGFMVFTPGITVANLMTAFGLFLWHLSPSVLVVQGLTSTCPAIKYLQRSSKETSAVGKYLTAIDSLYRKVWSASNIVISRLLPSCEMLSPLSSSMLLFVNSCLCSTLVCDWEMCACILNTLSGL